MSAWTAPLSGVHNARENLAFNVRTHNNWQANTLVTAIFLPFLVGKEQGEVTQHPMGETEKNGEKKNRTQHLSRSG